MIKCTLVCVGFRRRSSISDSMAAANVILAEQDVHVSSVVHFRKCSAWVMSPTTRVSGELWSCYVAIDLQLTRV